MFDETAETYSSSFFKLELIKKVSLMISRIEIIQDKKI